MVLEINGRRFRVSKDRPRAGDLILLAANLSIHTVEKSLGMQVQTTEWRKFFHDDYLTLQEIN